MMGEAKREEVIKVGIAEGAVARGNRRLRTTGLGSCVGLVLYDPVIDLAGMVHIMLPTAARPTDNPAKYADLAVPWLHARLCAEGADPRRVRAKLAGGAQMFAVAGKSDIMRVGPRNTEAVLTALEQLGVRVVAADTGGNVGRTIEFDPTTRILHVRTALHGAYEL